ncbi:MAG TPA: OmpA family protein [Magnetospirillaceae bacterium]|jgi:outer membrane protein OmpA-like peptidoglycan-associated protein
MRHLGALFASAAAAALITASAPAAFADDGWYFSAGAGANFVPDLKLRDTNPTYNGKVESNTGIGITAAGGYAFGPVRVEGELGWRDNGLDKAANPGGTVSASGDLQPWTLMANGYYDFATGTSWTPYLGAGVGMAYLDGNVQEAGTTVSELGRAGFAYQGMAGVAYKVSDALSLKGEYRYLATEQIEVPNTSAVGGGHGNMTYEAHSVLVGFIYHFGAEPKPMPAMAAAAAAPPPPEPPKAPEPVPAVVAPSAFNVFFDFDKSTITADTRKVIEQAAQLAKTKGAARIDLTGHTDTVGTDAYNMKLSVRRAEAVKKVLVQLGIPADEIDVVGKGKTDLLVPTADGVREPKNRRVEIVLPQ